MIGVLISLGYVVITALVGVITAAVVYARWHYGTLEKVKGLPAIIEPAIVGGSDVFVYKKIVHDQDIENVKKYGKIYGSYEGRFPHIYVADPELVRLICIKDFDHFHNKRIMDFGHKYINEMMDILPYDKWKIVRNFLSPTLTTGKIRHMSIQMTEAIQDWMETVKGNLQNDGTFQPKLLYTALSSDIIARCGFGTKLNSLHDPNNIFVKNIRSFSSEDEKINFMLTVTHVFPFLIKLAPLFPPGTLEFFADVLKNVMKSRRENNIKIPDFIEALNEMLGKIPTEEYKKHGITETTVMCQALFFFLAGFETTSFTLTFLSYNLAKNPDIQDKLLDEVDAYLARNNGKIEHETIGEMTYLAACVQETLRMFAPLIRLERVCNKDWHHEPSGLVIPKGVVVQIPVHSIHYNEEYFPHPHDFKPERFLAENKDKMNAYAFLGFGIGPHNCIGMRFAKESVTLAMANVLKDFKFRPNASTKIKFDPGRTFLLKSESFTLDAVKRIK
ncbi:Cytochrome P450 3A21 [Orchesella cincta]|uniref:Cytochrome P450 3A21 n=1 Tax=Orchesella cincta TaxID=48709 RepID=A0A1D2M779_ORCCI|nr:Cytochrome P450 3A21 [Orchesella cincta]